MSGFPPDYRAMTDGKGFTRSRIVWGAVIGVTGVLLAVLFVAGFQFALEHFFKPRAPKSAMVSEPRLPPLPRLEVKGGESLQQMLSEDRAHLNSYGWIDRDAGVAHIPIERAKALWLARQGVRAEQQP